MQAGLDIEFVKDNYQKMSDDDLIRTATTDAYGLTEEAMEVVKEEIIKRNLDKNIIKGLEAQNKTYSIEEIDIYAALIQKLPCPKCGNTFQKLNGTLTSEVMSFIVVSQYKRAYIVACPNCLDKATTGALTKTLLLGWWGIPWGIIRTFQAIGHYYKSNKQHHIAAPNNFLRSFILSNIGEIETHKADKVKLQQIIAGR
jgi:predicted nucleic-acid-binding Zn-ribbon protein